MLSLGKFEAPLLVMMVVILGGGGGGANGLQAGNFAGITINRHFRGDIFHNEGERRQFKRQEMLLFKFLHQLVRYAISRFMHFLSQSPSSHFPCYLFLPTWPSLSFSSPLVATQKRVRGLSNLPPASVTCVVWVLVCLPPVPHVHCTTWYLHRLLDPRLISLRPYSNIHNYPLPCLLLLSTFLISSSVFFSENFITYTYKYDDDNDGDGGGDGGDDHDGDARGDGYDHGDCILVTCPCLQKSIAIFFIAFWIIFIKINWNPGCCLIICCHHTGNWLKSSTENLSPQTSCGCHRWINWMEIQRIHKYSTISNAIVIVIFNVRYLILIGPWHQTFLPKKA